MVTSKTVGTVREVEPIDDAIAQQIEEAVKKAEEKAEAKEADKITMFFTMPFPGVRYYSFKESKAD